MRFPTKNPRLCICDGGDFSFNLRVFIYVRFTSTLAAFAALATFVLPATSVKAQSPVPVFSPPNYLADLLNSHRWRKLPVRVFFRKSGAYSPAYEKTVRAGFAEWTQATNGKIKMVLAPSEKQADVVVRFISGPNVPPDPDTVGETVYYTQGVFMQKALMSIATGGDTSLDEIQAVAAHEWGHALGIHGHSKTKTDIMYGVTLRYQSFDPDFVPPPPTQVGPRDAATLLKIYAPYFRQ